MRRRAFFASERSPRCPERLHGAGLLRPRGCSASKRIAQDLDVPELSENLEIRIKAGLVASSKKYSADDQDFLNSFFVKDRGKVAAEVRERNLGKGCWTFLSGNDELDLSKRMDVRKSIDTLFQ